VLGTRFTGYVYRAHNPEWAWKPLSGAGAKQFGGRFNSIGVPALYTALTLNGALREASPLGRPFQPITICQYEVDCKAILDTRDANIIRREKITNSELDCKNWRAEMLAGAIPASQSLAERLIKTGYVGMIVKSFANGAGLDDFNLVFWKWRTRKPYKVTIIDPERRLPKNRSSWD